MKVVDLQRRKENSMAIYSTNKKKAIISKVAHAFATNKSVPAGTKEFMELSNRPEGIKATTIRQAFGNWGKFINAVQKQEKALWDEATAVKAQPQVKAKVKKDAK